MIGVSLVTSVEAQSDFLETRGECVESFIVVRTSIRVQSDSTTSNRADMANAVAVAVAVTFHVVHVCVEPRRVCFGR